MKGHIILCGLGKVGFSILELLHGLGEHVVVVSREVPADWMRRARSMAGRLVLDDARSDEVLLEAGLRQARALIVATNDDLANIEVALDADRLAPGIPVVVRMYDDDLAERVRRELPVRAVLNAAALSAPAFVAAALGEHVLRALDVEGTAVTILTLRVKGPETGEGSTLAALAQAQNVIPLAVRAGDASHRLAPALDSVLARGDEVVAASAHGPEADALPSAPARRRFWPVGRPAGWSGQWERPRVPLWRLVGVIWRNAPPALRAVFLLLQLLLLIGVGVFRVALDLSWIDALYFTVTVMTTVGFGDITLLHAHPLVKLFGCALMIAGASTLVVIFSIISDYLVTQRMERLLGPARSTASGHIVVVGIGNLGLRVAQRLHALGRSVLAVERNEHSQLVSRLPPDVPVVIGDASRPDVLHQAAVDRAEAVLALTDDDLVNLRIAHEVKQAPKRPRTVARLFQSMLAGKLGPATLGIDQALNPSQAAAATFAACALVPSAVHGFTLGGRLLVLRWTEPGEAAPLIGRSIAGLREDGILVLTARRAASPEPVEEDVVRPGDRLLVLEEYLPARRRTAAAALVELGEEIPAAVERLPGAELGSA